ncbi:MAG: 3-phosphoserine/phosphohydroxythreonine transaminase [Candidatus Margulisiibacteriota bacterium]
MNRVYNFSAGPATLPEEVLQTAQQELLNYNDCGMSVMELSHRSSTYEEIIGSAEANLRKLMAIPDSYAVLFMQGGATAQFSMVPLNLMGKYKRACYINTGVWSQKAIKEAKRYGEVSVVASSEDKNFSYIPDMQSIRFDDQADYLHMTSNNTIEGTRFPSLPKTSLPIVSDMSSMILSEKITVTDYGLIYAGAQKNIGPAGVAIVIVKKDLMGHEMPVTPILYQYKATADEHSMLNTPPTYAIYMAGLVFKWLLDLGGVEAIEIRNKEKAKLLYDFLDQSKLFKSPINQADRSLMNVPFTSPSEEIDKAFIQQAEAQGLVNLKGHRLVGGMRASIYNAMPTKGVETLIAFMDSFEKQ